MHFAPASNSAICDRQIAQTAFPYCPCFFHSAAVFGSRRVWPPILALGLFCKILTLLSCAECRRQTLTRYPP